MHDNQGFDLLDYHCMHKPLWKSMVNLSAISELYFYFQLQSQRRYQYVQFVLILGRQIIYTIYLLK